MSESAPFPIARPEVADRSAGARALEAIARHLWTGEPGMCEAHWGSLTLAVTAALSAITATWAGVVDPESALDVVLPAATVALVLQLATRLGATRAWFRFMTVRRLLGPLVLVSAALATGFPDVITMAPSPTAPLIIGALVFGALTPGFLATMLMAAAAILALPLLHVAPPGATLDVADIQVVLRGLAAVAGATGAGLAWRHLRRGEERARRRVAHLEGITAILRRFDGSRPTTEVLGDMAADLVIATRAGSVVIHLEDGGNLVPAASAGDASALAAITESRVVERAAATRTTQPAAADAQRRWRVNGRGAQRGEPIAVPVAHEDMLLAVIELRDIPGGGEADARALAELVASAIAGALRAAWLDAQRGVRLATFERLVRSGRALSANLDRERVVAEACALAAELLDADVSAFVRAGEDGSWIIEDGVGLADATLGLVLRADEPLVVLDPSAPATPAPSSALAWSRILARLPEAGHRPHALALPLVMDDEIVALVGVARPRHDRAFSEADVAAADLLAIQVGTALRNAEQHSHAVDLAIRDGLTGLLNRRYFDEALRRASAAARREGEPLSLLMMDLDRFSLVNNEHGHAVGDEVLRRVAGVLLRHCREADVVARYGGEEFVLIAPGADADAAQLVAERIRLAVAELSHAPIDGLLLRTAISVGVATLDDDEVADGTALFRRADDRLRAAKLAGRNRVIGA